MLSVLLPVDNPPADTYYTASYGDIYSPPLDEYGSLYDIILDDEVPEEAEYTVLPDDQLTFQAEPDTENITEVIIDGCVYTLGYEPLEPGEFTFDPDTGTVIVQLKQPIHETTVVNYRTPAPIEPIRSNCICDRTIVPIFQKWNIKESDITISYSFGAEPTLSDFSFIACKSDINLINSQLCNGTEFAAYNNRWVINSTTIVLLKNSDQIGVNVSSVHWLAARGNPSKSPLDKLVRIKPRTGNGGYARSKNISEFATLSGVPYTGVSFSTRIDRSTSNSETKSMRQMLTENATKTHGFVYYSKNGVEVRPWGQTRIHSISEHEVKNDIALTQSGHGSLEDGIKLHTEYRNVKVNLDFDPDQSDRKVGVTQRWAFENCRDLFHLYNPVVYTGFYFRAPKDELYRNVGINFDAGGEVKKGTRITELNGTITFEEHYEYSNAFSSDESYDVIITSQGNIQLKFKTIQTPYTYHKEVKRTIINHIFDTDGYKIATLESGFQLARLQQESQKLEAITLRGQAAASATDVGGIITPDPSLTAQADAYRFTERLPIDTTTVYELAKHEDYFDDTVKPEEKCEDDYVPPKFVQNKYYRLETEIIRPIRSGFHKEPSL